MAVSISDIKELREITGAGLAEVKKALEAANGDRDEAIKAIRLAGQKSLSKREDRSTSNGLVLAKVIDKDGGQEGVVIELNSETDFVGKSPKFVECGEKVLEAAVSSDASTVEELLAAPCGEGTVKDQVEEIAALFAEHIVLGKVARLTGEVVTAYLHYSSADLPPQVAVLVATDKAGATVGHDLALQISAYNPECIYRDEIPAADVEKERQTLVEITLSEGKPERIVDKIVDGRLISFYKERCLMDQDYMRDPKTTVGEVVKKSGGKVTGFVRFHVGA